MLPKLGDREDGFTLIELLVVIHRRHLAAIALPSFLGQQKKGRDASAKSDVRNAVSQIESCFTETQKYTLCADSTAVPQLLAGAVISGPVDPAAGTNGGYTVTAASKSGNSFVITKNTNGSYARTFTTANNGGSPTGGSW
jgi:type IV pilus assembly protein PilA